MCEDVKCDVIMFGTWLWVVVLSAEDMLCGPDLRSFFWGVFLMMRFGGSKVVCCTFRLKYMGYLPTVYVLYHVHRHATPPPHLTLINTYSARELTFGST